MRVPPTEKRGRVQTSTITVAVLEEPKPTELHLDERDLEIRTCRGSGAGGQHRNKTESAVQILHKPTGIIVRCENERSQTQNKASAIAALRAKLWAVQNDTDQASRAATRQSQVGSGQRADKRRTVKVPDDKVIDHVTGKTWRYKDYIRGIW